MSEAFGIEFEWRLTSNHDYNKDNFTYYTNKNRSFQLIERYSYCNSAKMQIIKKKGVISIKTANELFPFSFSLLAKQERKQSIKSLCPRTSFQ
jgi:hypothetical protein